MILSNKEKRMRSINDKYDKYGGTVTKEDFYFGK